MKRDTLEQAYLAREQMKDQAKGLTESSRAALSAVSGRNILKTKEETAKIKRDQEIAAQQIAASIAMSQADQGIALEKAKTSIAQQKDHTMRDDTAKLLDGGVYEESFLEQLPGLGSHEAARNGNFAHQRQVSQVKRSQIMAMLNVGVYDPNFAAELGMKDSVVKEFADKKAKEIAAARAKAAAKKQAEYQAAMNKLQTRVGSSDIAEKEKELKELDAKIAASSKSLGGAAAAAALTAAQNTAVQKNLMQNVMAFQNQRLGIEPKTKTPTERPVVDDLKGQRDQLAKEIETIKMRKNVQDAMASAKSGSLGYDKKISEDDQIILAALGIEPEKANGAIIALKDKAFKYTEASIELSKQKMQSATNDADYKKYAEEHLNKIDAFIAENAKSVNDAVQAVSENLERTTKISKEQYDDLVSAKERAQKAVALLKKLAADDAIADEGKSAIQSVVDLFEEEENVIDFRIRYYEDYESVSAALIKSKLDPIYGGAKSKVRSALKEYEAAINGYENDPNATFKGINITVAGKKYTSIDDLKTDHAQLIAYATRNNINDQYEAETRLLNAAGGETLFDQFEKLWSYTYEEYEADEKKWFGKDFNPITDMPVSVFKKADTEEEFEEEKTKAREVYLKYLKGDWEERYKDGSLTENVVIPDITGEYDGGRRETYLVGFLDSDFSDDVAAFGRGDFGYFTEEEGRRVNAIYRDHGAAAAFDYYITVREEALVRQAKDKNTFDLVFEDGFVNVASIADFYTNVPAYAFNLFNLEEAKIASSKASVYQQEFKDRIADVPVLSGAFEVADVIGSMAPQLALAHIPVVGPALSLGYVGTSSLLEGYSQQVALGKQWDEALTVAALSAASEVVLSKVLSGIGGVGGKYSIQTFFDDGISKMSTAPAVKKTMKLILSMGGEGLEESMQVVLQPFFEEMADELVGMGDDELQDIDWDEVAKTFVISAISAGLLDGWRSLSSEEIGSIKKSKANRMIADNSAIDLIRDAAAMDVAGAQRVKAAILGETPRFKNQQGLRAYVSPSELMSISADYSRAVNDSIIENAKKSMAGLGARNRDVNSAAKQIRKILYGEKIKASDVKALLKNDVCADLLEGITGADLRAMDPKDARAVLRIAAFPGTNTATIKNRLKLFRNKFEELDMDALRMEVHYADVLSSSMAGVVYETEAVAEKIGEAERERVKVLESMLADTGLRVLVSDRLATNTFPTLGVIAVNTADLTGENASTVYQAVGYGAYRLAQDMSSDLGNDLRDFILKELEQQIGKEALDAEIKKIRQQGAANGLDISEEAAKDELCARMLPEILLKNAEGLAAENPELAEKVRKALEAMNSELNSEEDGANAVKDMAEGSEQKKNGIEIGGYTENDMQVNARHILNMNSVFDIPSEKLKKSGKRPSEMFSDFFVSVGEVISTDELGDVALAHSSVKSEVRHGITAEKIASIEAIPEVLRKGRVIFCGLKDVSGVERIVVCAPITIGGELYYMGIMIQRDKQNQRLYFHNVISEKEMSSFSEADLLTTGALENDKHLFLYSILQNRLYVNNQKNLVFTQEVVDRLAAALDPYRLAMDLQTEQQGDLTADERIVDEIFNDDNDGGDEDSGGEFRYVSSEQVAEENDGADFSKTFDNMTPDERDAAAQQMGRDLNELLEQVADEQRRAEDASADKQAAMQRVEEMTGHSPEKEKTSLREKAHDIKAELQYQLTDTGVAVNEIGKEIGDRSLYDSFNMARSAEQAGMSQILDKQTDIFGREVGKGLKEIWKPIMKQGEEYQKAFDQYLLHWHNIDRMSRRNYEAIEEARGYVEFYRAQLSPAYKKLSKQDLRSYVKDESRLYHIDPTEYQATYNDVLLETAEDFQTAKEYVEALDRFNALDRMYNKPIWGWDVTADVSREAIRMLEAEHPEFKQYAADVWNYTRNLNKNRVDSGLITSELATKLQEVYPHYVPVVYADDIDVESDRSVQEEAEDLGKEGTGKTVKRAKGGEGRVLTIRSQLASQTLSVAREGAINRFGEKLIQAHDENGSLKHIKRIEKREDLSATTETFDLHIDEQDPFAKSDGKKMFSVFLRGVRYDIEVDDLLFDAIESLRPDPRQSGALYRWGQINVTLFKKMITAYNPLFTLRNFTKDMWDAAFTSQSTLRWSKNLPKALYQIIRNGEQYRQYKALGGGYSSFTGVDKVFDEKGTKNPFKWLGMKMEVINQAVEQLPRFAEFLATVEKSNGNLDGLMEALYNADDITTNFGRAGKLGKNLNRYVIPFFNPAMQGMSKAVRLVTERPSFKSYLRLAIKAAAIGFAPALINGLLFGDDDEWDQINQRDKDLYFLWKVSDGCWIKIPKGRLASIVGMSGERIRQVFSGEDVEWAEFFGTAVEQVAPSNPLTSNIVGPLFLASINRTWWGGEIENERLQQYDPSERYDTKTDELSKWLGSVTGLSPKKINYVLDAYTGVFGDVLLPMMTPAAEQGFLEKAFTVDTNYSNRLTGDFYERLDELTWIKNNSDATAVDQVVYRWWTKNSEKLSEINKEIREIEESAVYSASEKEDKVDAQYIARNAALLNFEETYDQYVAAAEKIAKDHPDLNADDLYRETNCEVFGAEAAILTYNKEVHARAVEENKENGISFDDFYDIYFDKSVDTTYALNMMADGFVKEDSMEISAALETLEPLAGKENVSYVQKVEAILNTDVSEYEKMRAMAFFGNETEKRRLAIVFGHNIGAEEYLRVKQNIEFLDGTKNSQIQAAIDHVEGLSKEEKAILWQLMTGSTSAKNNPFSVTVGNRILEEVEAYKATNE